MGGAVRLLAVHLRVKPSRLDSERGVHQSRRATIYIEEPEGGDNFQDNEGECVGVGEDCEEFCLS